ncbi:cation diffusion facilitator family transporter [Vitreoscilla massiliensis]|uniref:Cation diffusion facilitator family transporter n=1 Tax=Vitreoscilla massiliensis TaxID=1689272 RepID=A0ABY4E7Q2_9NEIS|nr:cation diffusion facilitator family transporter [Vitreoscilla massiliensis]UOO90453.1 cation diffusion facilitator family transporter [Vitreoscilla massiliensis]
MTTNTHHHDHTHDHHHSNNQQVLLWSFVLISAFMVVEAIGGWLTNSLALLSDAGHMLSDALSLGIALLAFRFGAKAANAGKSFGYRRFEILAAAFNGLTLMAVAVWIVIEAVTRFVTPLPIQSTGMLVIATLGLIVNIVVAVMMFKSGDTHDNLNMRGAFLHVISDLLGSVAAIIAALAVRWYGWTWADPLISVLVAILVFRSGFFVLREAAHVLMEGTPRQIDPAHIRALLLQQPEVVNIHDLHVWSISSGEHALASHVVIQDDMRLSEVQTILHQLEALLQQQGIAHVTLQVESTAHGHNEADMGLQAASEHEHEHTQTHAHSAHTHPHQH